MGLSRFGLAAWAEGPERDYRGEIDLFAVYCHERAEVCLVPVEHVPTRLAHLRLSAAKNGQRSGVRWASRYLLSPAVDTSAGEEGLS